MKDRLTILLEAWEASHLAYVAAIKLGDENLKALLKENTTKLWNELQKEDLS